MSSLRGSILLLAMIMLFVAVPGCGGGKNADVALLDDDTPVLPDSPIVLQLSARNQVKIMGRWFDIWGDVGQLDEYLSRRAQKYKAMYQEHGIELDKRNVRGECLRTLPTEVVIEPEERAKVGAVSRLTRICQEHGFYNVRVRRENEAG